MNDDVMQRLPMFDLTRWEICTWAVRRCQPGNCNLMASDAKTTHQLVWRQRTWPMPM